MTQQFLFHTLWTEISTGTAITVFFFPLYACRTIKGISDALNTGCLKKMYTLFKGTKD